MVRVLDLTEQVEGKSVWVVGDIHGEFDLFCALLDKMGYQRKTHMIISVGDLVDRGPNSPGVVDWFLKNGNAVRGNHEEMWLETTGVGTPYDDCGLREAWALRNHGAWLYANGMDKTMDQFMDANIPASRWLGYFEGLPYASRSGNG